MHIGKTSYRLREKQPSKNEAEECRMQRMKSGLMMFCLTVLLSCAALMMNTSTASAMTLMDLQGDYRIVGAPENGTYTTPTKGSIVTFANEDGDLIGRITKPSHTSPYSVGDPCLVNIYVDNGVIYGTWVFEHNGYREVDDQIIIRVFNHGGTLRIEGDKKSGNSQDFYWELRRL